MNSSSSSSSAATPAPHFLHICETAFLSKAGHLNIIGIFEQLHSVSLPYTHPKMTVIANITLQKGEYPFHVRIAHHKTNTEVARAEGVLNLETTKKVGIINEFLNTSFSEYGKYSVELWIDNTPSGKVVFTFEHRE